MLDVHLESQNFIWCFAFCKKNMWVQETRGGSRRDLLYHPSCELLRSVGFQASQPRVFRVFTPQSMYFHWSISLQLPLGHSGHLVCKDQQARGRVIILAKSDPLGWFSVLSCPVVTINGQIQLPWAKQGSGQGLGSAGRPLSPEEVPAEGRGAWHGWWGRRQWVPGVAPRELLQLGL